MFSATYTRDFDGHITVAQEVSNGSSHETDYAYDADGRLVRETIDPAAPTPRVLTYAYDLAGNRVASTDTGAPAGQQSLSDSYDADGRLISVYGQGNGGYYSASYTYDAAGNTLTASGSQGSSTSTWDAEGRLATVTVTSSGTTRTVSYTYDDAGNRVSETINGTTTTFLNDPNSAYDQVLEEYAPGGVLSATYVRGLDLLFQDRATVLSYYAVDQLGSTRSLTNASGAVTDTYTYDAYGNPIGSTGTTINPYQYAGQRLDAGTGLYDMGARVYDALTGQFTSRDTYDGSTSNPITLNHYAYAGGDPVNMIDPSGHDETAVESLGTLTIGENLALIGAIGVWAGGRVLESILASAPQLAPLAAELGVKVITNIQKLPRGRSVSLDARVVV